MVIYFAVDRPLEFVVGEDAARACYVHCTPPSLEYVAQMFAETRGRPAAGRGPVLGRVPGLGGRSESRAGRGRGRQDPGEVRAVRDRRPHVGRRQGAYADHVVDLLTRALRAELRGEHHRPRRAFTRWTRRHSSAARCAAPSCRARSCRTRAAPCARFPSSAGTGSRGTNVYLCGAGSHPGPGVSFMPGRNAAQVIERRARPRPRLHRGSVVAVAVARLVEDHGLRLDEVPQTLDAALATDARLLEAAERDAEVGAERVVPDRAGAEVPRRRRGRGRRRA